MKRASQIRRQAGSILVYTLLSLTVLSMVMTVVYDQLIGIMKSSRSWLWKEKAMVAAESAAAAAEGRLLAQPAWTAGENDGPEWQFLLDDAHSQVRTERFRPPDVIWIFASGSYKREQKNLVRPIIVRDPTLFAVMARGSLRVKLGSIVQGSVYGDGVVVEEGGEVVGSIISISDISIAHRPPETILFDSATTPPIAPGFKPGARVESWKLQWPKAGSRDTSVRPGYYIHQGDLALKDFAEGNVSIRVNGNLDISGRIDLRFEPSVDTPILYVEKDLTGTLTEARIFGVIYVNGRIALKGEGLITGALIGDDIELGRGVVVQSFDAVPTVARPPAAFWSRVVRRIKN